MEAPDEAEGGGGPPLLLLADGAEKLKLPKVELELEAAANGDAEGAAKGDDAEAPAPNGEAPKFMAPDGKFDCVGEANVSVSSSSSSRRCIGPRVLCWNGLVPGKVLSAVAGPLKDVECCCARSTSARCDSRRR